MATEKRRSRQGKSISTVRPRNYSDLYKHDHTMSAPDLQTVAATGAVATKIVHEVDWSTEYVYVTKDLQQLLTVSAILFILIIAAGFFL
jgi:hypothetical protein